MSPNFLLRSFIFSLSCLVSLKIGTIFAIVLTILHNTQLVFFLVYLLGNLNFWFVFLRSGYLNGILVSRVCVLLEKTEHGEKTIFRYFEVIWLNFWRGQIIQLAVTECLSTPGVLELFPSFTHSTVASAIVFSCPTATTTPPTFCSCRGLLQIGPWLAQGIAIGWWVFF